MDRHLAALLKALSFKQTFKSRARTIDLLNSVNPIECQVRHALPQAGPTRPIEPCVRKSSDTRRNHFLLSSSGTRARDTNNNTGIVQFMAIAIDLAVDFAIDIAIDWAVDLAIDLAIDLASGQIEYSQI